MANQLDWMVVGGSSDVEDVQISKAYTYDLVSITQAEALRYGERAWGINLVWTDPAKSDNIRFHRNGGRVDLFEKVAINVRGGGWLVYKRRRWGVNLGWSDEPSFEWSFRDSAEAPDKAGPQGALKTNTVVGLYNDVENDFLIYDRRDFGINLRWWKDRDKGAPFTDAADVANKAKELLDSIFGGKEDKQQ